MPIKYINNGPISQALSQLSYDKIEHLTLLNAGFITYQIVKHMNNQESQGGALDAAENILNIIGCDSIIFTDKKINKLKFNPNLFKPKQKINEDSLNSAVYQAALNTMRIQMRIVSEFHIEPA